MPVGRSWARYTLLLLGTFAGVLAALWLFVLAMNPYGNLPHLLFKEHAITDINQRQKSLIELTRSVKRNPNQNK